ncbi:hypothetical protein FHU28_000310 [Micromonospora echinospora]|uniref:Uncharacterized protein n=1 Tax=Micromonospora echinospora TaxID=1877 RepID=A0ABR6M513_MICEC|nr:hypothetical protein [Micromonospora echinospora]MBB5110471.1 hypothetical protein [Micromonospora echinospora]
MIVDEVFHQGGPGSYELTRVHHTDGYVLRVQVYRDSYAKQSTAVAEVLTPLFTWTIIASSPGHSWHRTTPTTAPNAGTLIPVADEVLQRARRILPVPPPFTAPGR